MRHAGYSYSSHFSYLACIIPILTETGGDVVLYRLNTEKALSWLQTAKLDPILANFEQIKLFSRLRMSESCMSQEEKKGIHCQVVVSKPAMSSASRIKYACGMVQDCLEDKWKKLLLQQVLPSALEKPVPDENDMDVDADSKNSMAKVATGTYEDFPLPGSKKAKTGPADKKKPKKSTASASVKQLAKVSTRGMKSITSYFSKK